MKIMIWNAARGGMRSVVEGYIQDGFIAAQNVRLIASYSDGGFLRRQAVLAAGLAQYVWLLATRRIELVHCHVAMRGSFWRKLLFMGLAHMVRCPFVYHMHGSEMAEFYARQPRALRAVIVRVLETAAAVIVLSQSWRAFVADIAPRANVVVIPNYVSLPENPAQPDPARTTILFLGAVGARKGIYDLLHALARVTATDVHLLIGGTGEIEKAKEIAQELGIADHVTFLGWVDAERRAALLHDASLFILPSYNEGLPMSVLEAMAAGLCVITTGVGGLPELVSDGETGILIAPGDVSSLAKAIADLANDAQRRNRIGLMARQRVADAFSRDVALGTLTACYRTVSRQVTAS